MKYCRNCGSEVEEGDIYCGYCGTKLKEDTPKESVSSRQDFKDESLAGADFAGDFDKDFEQSFDDGFDKDLGNSGDVGMTDNLDDEFESYVEDGNNAHTSFNSNNNSRSDGHKPLQFNKLAKEANTYGILALIFGLLGGILGIVFGVIGLQKAKKALELCNTGEYDGKPKASNGKILSIVGIVLGALSLTIYII